MCCVITLTKYLGPVVQTLVSSNPGNRGFFIFLSKALSRIIIFFFLFRVSNHQIAGKENWVEMNLLFKPSYLSSNFALTMGYLNPASKNPAQMFSWCPPVSYAGIFTCIVKNVEVYTQCSKSLMFWTVATDCCHFIRSVSVLRYKNGLLIPSF